MKSKQEVIQEAYKELGLPFHENYLYDNGWMKIKPSQYSSLYDKVDLLKLTAHVHSIRPKSLSGIETNNGWTRIENVDDIPKEITECYVFDDDGDICYYTFGLDSSKDYSEVVNGAITHYQPIIKPEAPIY